MNDAIARMPGSYVQGSMDDRRNAIKEIVQEVILSGLYKAGFFEYASFYGGTALRIFHGLDRFSEDLDFSLCYADPAFSFSPFINQLRSEVESYGIRVEFIIREKHMESSIRKMMVRGNLRELMLYFYADESIAGRMPSNEALKIKVEVDTNPPPAALYENKYRLLPSPYEVRLYDLPSMFAGKLHAVIARSWKARTKGRDLYDYLFYVSKGISVNMEHLRERLIASGELSRSDAFTTDTLKQMLYSRFQSIDYEKAKADVIPFIEDRSVLSIWSPGFFSSVTSDFHF